MKQLFITATDTDAGKTFVSCAITHALTHQQTSYDKIETKVAVFKPVSAGCENVNGELINEDAKLLCQFANCQQSIQEINPIAFEDPIAPHIAAKNTGQAISVDDIVLHFQQVKNLEADITLVEGAGGWRLPLGVEVSNTDNKGKYQFLSDFAIKEKLKVILIVNMKLGCLNHAMLTYETIKADGLDCIAWVANCASSDSMSNLSENIAELSELLPIPKLAQFDFIPDIDELGNTITLQDKIQLAAKQVNLAILNT